MPGTGRRDGLSWRFSGLPNWSKWIYGWDVLPECKRDRSGNLSLPECKSSDWKWTDFWSIFSDFKTGDIGICKEYGSFEWVDLFWNATIWTLWRRWDRWSFVVLYQRTQRRYCTIFYGTSEEVWWLCRICGSFMLSGLSRIIYAGLWVVFWEIKRNRNLYYFWYWHRITARS